MDKWFLRCYGQIATTEYQLILEGENNFYVPTQPKHCLLRSAFFFSVGLGKNPPIVNNSLIWNAVKIAHVQLLFAGILFHV